LDHLTTYVKGLGLGDLKGCERMFSKLNALASSTTLPQLMRELGITDNSVFENWLAEERAYLMSLNQEPKHETLQMEYWQKLVNMAASK
ncbi:hypothetical protein P692DRAFT_201700320, partial [Suillus brevipes Sb2]